MFNQKLLLMDMMKKDKETFGLMRVAAVAPQVVLGNPSANARVVAQHMAAAMQAGVSLLLLPELALTGTGCGDLFWNTHLYQRTEQALAQLLELTAGINVCTVVGMPLRVGTDLLSVAVVLAEGRLCGVVPKTCFAAGSMQQRWFMPADGQTGSVELLGQEVSFGRDLTFALPGGNFCIQFADELLQGRPCAAARVAEVVLLPSSLPAQAGRQAVLHTALTAFSAAHGVAAVYAAPGEGESSTDAFFSGTCLMAECGQMLAAGTGLPEGLVCEVDVDLIQNHRVAQSSCHKHLPVTPMLPVEIAPQSLTGTLKRQYSCTPFMPANFQASLAQEVFYIQVGALCRRLQQVGAKKVVIGVSGGLDSTLALLVAKKAAQQLQGTQVLGITMPGFGTSARTKGNSLALMNELGIEAREIEIATACRQHFQDIGHSGQPDVAFENAQARERTQVLMDVANICNGLVVGTGDLSELALGWATYNGDHMSMYSVNGGVPKTMVKELVRWYALQEDTPLPLRQTLLDVVDTPISPELLPTEEQGEMSQKTEDLVGPYELHDFFIYHLMHNHFSAEKIRFIATHAFRGTYTPAEVAHWLDVFLKRFFTQQFKRSCMPDGPAPLAVSLSPRGGWSMPSDISYNGWLPA